MCETDRPRLCRLQAGFTFDYHMKITPAVGNERGDIEIKDYVVLPHGQDNCLPPCPLILDFTITHDRFGRSRLDSSGRLTHTAL